MRRALIIGATSSLATVLARKLAEKRVDLVLAGRDVDELKRLQLDLAIRTQSSVEVKSLDLADVQLSAPAFVEGCGDFDAAFIFTGAMGDDNATTQNNIEQVIHINFTRTCIIVSAIADHMKGSEGTIAVISSVAGDRGRASNFVYGSAKAGLTAFVSGLRGKLFQEKSGVHVLTVKPGFVDTPMTFAMNSGLMATREQVAKDIIHAAEKKKNTIYTPRKWWLIMFIITHIPEFIFKRLKF